MPKLKEIMPDYQSYLDLGMSKDEVKKIARDRLKLQKQRGLYDTKKVSNDINMIPTEGSTPLPGRVSSANQKEPTTREYLKTSDDFIPQVTRGLANNFIKTAEFVKGTTGWEVPKYNELVKLGEDLDRTKEKISSAKITPKRAKEKQKLSNEAQNAKGFVDNAAVGVKQMYDTATHPSEWTLQGATEFVSDPTNALSFGVGRIATKGILSPALRAVTGGVAGSAENAALNAGIEYARALGEGKSKEEARKIALQSAGGGAFVGGVMGAAGGAMPRAKGKAEVNTPAKIEEVDSAFKGLGEEESLEQQSANRLIDIVDAEIEAHQKDAVIKQKSAELIQSGVVDPKIIETRIESSIKPSDTDILITKAINDGKPLPPTWTGGGILTKLENTINKKLENPDNARSVEDVFNRLKSYGASDELASVASEAYAKGDMSVFSDWYSQKIKDSIAKEAENIETIPKDIETIPKDTKTIPEVVKEGKLIDDVTGVKEDVEYKVLPREQIKTNFKAGDGYQFRSEKQDKVIKDIRDNFDADRHFGQDGGFDGVPVVDSKGNVLIGNHRAEAIKSMSDEQFAQYREKLREKYPDAKEGIMVRVLKDDKNAQNIAKVSNDRRVKADSEKLILDSAKYKEKIDTLPERVDSEVALKNHLGASDELESNRAVLATLTNERLPYAVDRYMKENPLDLNFKQMFYKNAYKLHNVSKLSKKDGYSMLDIAPLLDRAIDKITKSKADKKSNLNDIIEHYNEALKSGGKDIEGNTINSKEFAADILGVALKHYKTLKDDGIVEFGKRLDDAVEFVKEQKQPSLFGDAKKEPTLSDVALRFLNESDRSRLDLLDLKERIEKNEDTQRGNGRSDTKTEGRDTPDARTGDGEAWVSKGSDKGVPDDSSVTKRSSKESSSSKSKDNAKQNDNRPQSGADLDKSGTGGGDTDRVKLSVKDIDTILKTGEKKVVEKVSPKETEALGKEFNFKHPKNITRVIDKFQINHTLKNHGDPKKEASRGNIAITKEDIANYLDIVKDYDLKVEGYETKTGKPAIVYGKQINGYHMVVEEVRTGKSDLAFFTMRKTKGKLNRSVLMQSFDHPKTRRPDTTSASDSIIPKNRKNIKKDIQKTSKDIEKVSKEFDKLEKEGKVSTLLYEDIAKITKDTKNKKLGIKFNEKLDEPTKRLLKKNGYSYNRKSRAWERGLNKQAETKAKSLIKEIKGMRLDKENC